MCKCKWIDASHASLITITLSNRQLTTCYNMRIFILNSSNKRKKQQQKRPEKQFTIESNAFHQSILNIRCACYCQCNFDTESLFNLPKCTKKMRKYTFATSASEFACNNFAHEVRAEIESFFLLYFHPEFLTWEITKVFSKASNRITTFSAQHISCTHTGIGTHAHIK